MAIQTWETNKHFEADQLWADIVTETSVTPTTVECDGGKVTVEGPFSAQDFVDIETGVLNV